MSRVPSVTAAAAAAAAVAVAVAVLAACGSSGRGTAPTRPAAPTADPAPAAAAAADDAETGEPASSAFGARLVEEKGCTACHTVDGSPRIAPTFLGLVARATSGETRYADGTLARDLIGPGKLFPTVRDYIIAETLRPRERLVFGYPPTAPMYDGYLTENEYTAIAMYIESL